MIPTIERNHFCHHFIKLSAKIKRSNSPRIFDSFSNPPLITRLLPPLTHKAHFLAGQSNTQHSFKKMSASSSWRSRNEDEGDEDLDDNILTDAQEVKKPSCILTQKTKSASKPTFERGFLSICNNYGTDLPRQ